MFQAASGLAARGHEVTIVSRDGAELSERTREAGLRFLPLPIRHELDLSSVLALRRALDEIRPHVIHVHKGLSHTLALAASWRMPVPAFVVNRGVSFALTLWNRPKYRSRRVDRIVTVCDRIREIVIRTGKVEPARVETVYAGTDTDLFDPSRRDRNAFRREKAIPPGDVLVMQVGVRDWKGWRELVDAFATISRSRGGLRLAFVGCRNEEERAGVAAHASAAGVGDRVLSVEVRTDMPDVLAAADCVVDASWSGTGITGTIREAMALARPVIATDCGGNRELVSSPRFGWLVPPKNRDALAGALVDVLDAGDRTGEIGRAARDRVVEAFSLRVRIDRLEEIYRRIVRQKASA